MTIIVILVTIKSPFYLPVLSPSGAIETGSSGLGEPGSPNELTAEV